ncbi:MAG: ATP-binding cassette domain-containing protein, partial [Gemmatales bacterium]|nr:ATP-binding cassette domain-containing protein [Gemmatales bacterium]
MPGRCPALILENLGKYYNPVRQEKNSLRELVRTVASRFYESRYCAAGQCREPGRVWALRGFSATIYSGEIVGIIGHNGAGKSTLLKLISRITEPSEGRLTIFGTLASLLEVGVGFHPDLTGRENVYLAGALLQLSKRHIEQSLS